MSVSVAKSLVRAFVDFWSAGSVLVSVEFLSSSGEFLFWEASELSAAAGGSSLLCYPSFGNNPMVGV